MKDTHQCAPNSIPVSNEHLTIQKTLRVSSFTWVYELNMFTILDFYNSFILNIKNVMNKGLNNGTRA